MNTITAPAKRFTATCTCGQPLTGNGVTWKHNTKPVKRCTPHPRGSFTQI